MKSMRNLIHDKWLSSIIKKNCYNLIVDDVLISRSKQDGTEEFNWCQSICEKKIDSLFIQSKISVINNDFIRFLEELGFYLIDTNVTLKRIVDSQIVKTRIRDDHGIEIRYANNSDREGTVSVGNSTFIYSRFHLDPWFSNDLANIIKAQWVSNYFEGKRGEQMVVASMKDKIVGFLQILKPRNDHFIIDLIGVDKEYQRRGIARRMIDYAIQNNKDIQYIVVGTQIGNIPSIKLYQQMDFFFENAKYVFHFHQN